MLEEAPKFKIRKKKLGTYPYISVVFSITLALLVIGIFGLLLIYSKEFEVMVRENVKIQVYLKNHITEAQRLQIQKNLSARYFVAKGEGKNPIQFVSKDEAAEQMIKDTGKEDFRKLLGENPLRDAFLVGVDPAFVDTTNLAKIRTEVEQISGVFQVYYEENVIDSINKNVTTIALSLLGIAAILLVTVVLLIHNTLRLALFSQRFLIRSMQLVGAKRWFIQRPFLIRASLHGLVAGLLAAALLVPLVSYVNKKIEIPDMIHTAHRINLLFGALLLLGVLVAVTSTYRAVRKYLRLSLDELY